MDAGDEIAFKLMSPVRIRPSLDITKDIDMTGFRYNFVPIYRTMALKSFLLSPSACQRKSLFSITEGYLWALNLEILTRLG